MRTLFRIPAVGEGGPFGRLIRALIWLVVAALVYLGFFAVVALLARYPNPSPAQSGVVRGAFHVHTVFSDGKGSVEAVAQAAKEGGNDFVVVTDHNVEIPPEPRFLNGVLMAFGNELSTPAGHLVALGASRGLLPVERQTAPLSKVTELGGYTVLAHPVQARNGWLDWSAARRAAGLELYSADSMFRLALRNPLFRLAPALGAYFINREHALMTLVQDQPEVHERLLALSQDAPKVALCSADAHGLPPYRDVFSAMSTFIPSAHPLPSSPVEAARFIFQAIAAGRSYCVFRPLGDGAGFAVEGLAGEVRQAKVGDVVRVRLPSSTSLPTQLRVLGAGVVQPDGMSVVMQRPGAVQIEVWALGPGRFVKSEWKPWIVPSPIWVYAGDAVRPETD